VPYANRQAMIDRFSAAELRQLTDKGEIRADAIVDSVLDQALADASAEIDGYLAGRYVLPLDPVPANLALICCDIARYRLQHVEPGEVVVKRYEAALKFLRLVAIGDIALGGSGVRFTSGQKAFARDNL
jgi:phage gp36-like protein